MSKRKKKILLKRPSARSWSILPKLVYLCVKQGEAQSPPVA
jgi:hypothetical protein